MTSGLKTSLVTLTFLLAFSVQFISFSYFNQFRNVKAVGQAGSIPQTLNSFSYTHYDLNFNFTPNGTVKITGFNNSIVFFSGLGNYGNFSLSKIVVWDRPVRNQKLVNISSSLTVKIAGKEFNITVTHTFTFYKYNPVVKISTQITTSTQLPFKIPFNYWILDPDKRGYKAHGDYGFQIGKLWFDCEDAVKQGFQPIKAIGSITINFQNNVVIDPEVGSVEGEVPALPVMTIHYHAVNLSDAVDEDVRSLHTMQKHMFESNGLLWVFYYNATNILYRYVNLTDGAVSSVMAMSAPFTPNPNYWTYTQPNVFCDGSQVYLVFENRTSAYHVDFYYVNGTLEANSITWNASVVSLKSLDGGTTYTMTGVSTIWKNGSVLYAIIGYGSSTYGYCDVYVLNSTDNGATWGSITIDTGTYAYGSSAVFFPFINNSLSSFGFWEPRSNNVAHIHWLSTPTSWSDFSVSTSQIRAYLSWYWGITALRDPKRNRYYFQNPIRVATDPERGAPQVCEWNATGTAVGNSTTLHPSGFYGRYMGLFFGDNYDVVHAFCQNYDYLTKLRIFYKNVTSMTDWADIGYIDIGSLNPNIVKAYYFPHYTNGNETYFTPIINYTEPFYRLTLIGTSGVHEDNTLYNHYWAKSGANVTAQFNISISNPYTWGVKKSRVKFLMPKGYQLINITTSLNVALSTSEYNVLDFNDTHVLYDLPEATIDKYGGEFKVFVTMNNAIHDLRVEHNGELVTYASSSSTVNIAISTIDPYGNPIDQPTTFFLLNTTNTNDVENRTDGTSVNGWFNFTLTLPSIKQVYTVQANTSGSYPGIMNLTKLKVTDITLTLTVGKSRLNVGASTTISGTAVYDFDNSTVPNGYVVVNGTACSVSNGEFSFNVSQSSVGKWTYQATSANDSLAVNTVSGVLPSESVIWDGLKVVDYKVDVASEKVHVKLVYGFDGAPVVNGNVSLAGLSAATNSTGWAEFDMSGASDFSWGSPAFGVKDDAYGITFKLQNQTIPIAKKNWLIESDCQITDLQWEASKLSLSFNETGSYTLKVSGPHPTYILNVTYDLTVNYTNYLALTHDGSRRIVISYENWGDFYIQSLNAGVFTDAYWTENKLTLVLNGTQGVSGELTVYCGSRGNPKKITGFTSSQYDAASKLFKGAYCFSSPITLSIDWGAGTSGYSGTPPSLDFYAYAVQLETCMPGATKNFELKVEFSTYSVTITGIEFSGTVAEWFKLQDELPFKFTRGQDIRGTALIHVQAEIPKEATPGTYKVPVTIYAITPYGQHLQCGSSITLTVTSGEITQPTRLLGNPMIILALVAGTIWLSYYSLKKR